MIGGWDLREIDRSVRIGMTRWANLAADRQDVYQAGWDGVVDLLLEQPGAAARDMVRAADTAIGRMRATVSHHHGYTPAGVGTAPNFLRYWHHGGHADFTDGVVERLALPRVVLALPDHLRRAIVARAAADVREAATLAGVTVETLRSNVRAARQAVLALWLQHETPRREARKQPLRRKVLGAQPCGTVSAYVGHRRRREQACQDCRAAATTYQRQRQQRKKAAA